MKEEIKEVENAEATTEPSRSTAVRRSWHDDLEKNCWYWFCDPREGDIWHPCYVRQYDIIMDGKTFYFGEFKDVVMKKAVMPEGM